MGSPTGPGGSEPPTAFLAAARSWRKTWSSAYTRATTVERVVRVPNSWMEEDMVL